MLINWLIATWEVVLASAPWLLIGFFISGLLHVFLPTSSIQKHLGKPGLGSILKASAFGVPLPLCSCSVIPVALSLRRAGASRGATASFFVSTPEIGVDSFLLSYGLLGPFLAVARVIVSFISAVLVGIGIDLFGERDSETINKEKNVASCCHNNPAQILPNKSKSVLGLTREVIDYGFFEAIADIARPLTLGFIIAGLISSAFPESFFNSLQVSSLLSMLIVLLISLPMYICATSSTPLAAALLLKGLDPGSVLVLMLAGPATNIATILVLKQELGTRSLAIYLSVLIIVTFLAGAVLNYLYTPGSSWGIPQLGHEHHQTVASMMSAVLFIALLVTQLLKGLISEKRT